MGAAIIYPLAVRVVRHAEGIDTNGGTDEGRMLLVESCCNHTPQLTLVVIYSFQVCFLGDQETLSLTEKPTVVLREQS